MLKFVIEPYAGPRPLRFGMLSEEVEKILGKPHTAHPDTFGGRIENRPFISIGYFAEEEKLVEAVFSDDAKILFEGRSLLSDGDPLEYLSRFDSSPIEWVGSIIFLKLGIAVTGVHDNDDSQKAISVIQKGLWDKYTSKFVPYKRA